MGESRLARLWANQVEGRLDIIAEYERQLPLILCMGDTLFSHSLPAEWYPERLIMEKNYSAFINFAWTDNTRFYNRQVVSRYASQNARWIVGHAPVFTGPFLTGVTPKYILQDKKVIQINAPDAYMVGVIVPGKPFQVYCISDKNRGKDLELL
jgi:hypothetical protein